MNGRLRSWNWWS